LAHFRGVELKLRNEDKEPIVKILKGDYDKLRFENENLLIENKKLKKDKSIPSNDGVNVNKV
jgi:hypothetical protein